MLSWVGLALTMSLLVTMPRILFFSTTGRVLMVLVAMILAASSTAVLGSMVMRGLVMMSFALMLAGSWRGSTMDWSMFRSVMMPVGLPMLTTMTEPIRN